VRVRLRTLEINDKDKFIKSGDVVLDLGAAPGGWSQVAIKMSLNSLIQLNNIT
jgi:23S rRNA (uridine2552-2'-O)-methyltransferase